MWNWLARILRVCKHDNARMEFNRQAPGGLGLWCPDCGWHSHGIRIYESAPGTPGEKGAPVA